MVNLATIGGRPRQLTFAPPCSSMIRFLRCLNVLTSIAQYGSPCGECVSRVEFSSGLLTGSDLADSGADRSSTPRKTRAG